MWISQELLFCRNALQYRRGDFDCLCSKLIEIIKKKDVGVNWDSFLPIRQVGTHARTRQLGDSFGVVMHNTPHVIVRVQGALLRGIMTVINVSLCKIGTNEIKIL